VSLRRVLVALAVSGLVLAVLALDVLLVTWVGSLVLTLVLGSLATREMLDLLEAGGSAVAGRVGLVAAILLMAMPAAWNAGVATGLAVTVVAILLATGRRIGPTLLGVVWVGGCLASLFLLRLLTTPDPAIDLGGKSIPLGLSLVIVVAVSVKGGDSAAYFVGRSIGRIPMAPRISPRKTWEGAIGGFVVGTALAPLVGLPLGVTAVLGVVELLVLGAAVNVAGQLGDLAESHVKRRAGVKDSGRYLGELGGALDILDAVLVASPVAYFVARLLGCG
jgi:phosphatidate cytidylyltransferase